MEEYRRLWEIIEENGRLWKTMEDYGKYGSMSKL